LSKDDYIVKFKDRTGFSAYQSLNFGIDQIFFRDGKELAIIFLNDSVTNYGYLRAAPIPMIHSSLVENNNCKVLHWNLTGNVSSKDFLDLF